MPLLRPLILIAIIGGIIGLGYVVSFQKQLLPQALATYHPQIAETMSGILGSTTEKIAWIKEHQLQPFGQTLQDSRVLGVDTNAQKPVHERAFDFARYQYCKQVIKDWEEGQSPTPTESTDPTDSAGF